MKNITKKCNTCNKSKEASEFHKCSVRVDGLQVKCKECYSDYNKSEKRRKANAKYHKSYRKKNTEVLKNAQQKYTESVRTGDYFVRNDSKATQPDDLLTCSTCKEQKVAAEGFYLNPSSSRLYAYSCKECSKAYTVKRRENKKRA